VRREKDLGTLAGKVFDGGDGTTDTGIVGDLALLQRHVEVGTDKNSARKYQENTRRKTIK
jgi:hypothetical protein